MEKSTSSRRGPRWTACTYANSHHYGEKARFMVSVSTYYGKLHYGLGCQQDQKPLCVYGEDHQNDWTISCLLRNCYQCRSLCSCYHTSPRHSTAERMHDRSSKTIPKQVQWLWWTHCRSNLVHVRSIIGLHPNYSNGNIMCYLHEAKPLLTQPPPLWIGNLPTLEQKFCCRWILIPVYDHVFACGQYTQVHIPAHFIRVLHIWRLHYPLANPSTSWGMVIHVGPSRNPQQHTANCLVNPTKFSKGRTYQVPLCTCHSHW